MSDKPMSKSRRDAVKMMMGGLVAVPLMNLVGMAAAQAEDLPHVDEATDPTAMALKYKHDAAASERPSEDQSCSNCMHIGTATGDWVPCALFPGKAVAAAGWCSGWTAKPAA